jgi:hypothetical protein
VGIVSGLLGSDRWSDGWFWVSPEAPVAGVVGARRLVLGGARALGLRARSLEEPGVRSSCAVTLGELLGCDTDGGIRVRRGPV